MKKLILFLLIVIFTVSVNGQRKGQFTQEQLNLNLVKAKNKELAGFTMTLGGCVLNVIGIALLATAPVTGTRTILKKDYKIHDWRGGWYVLLAGIGFTATGIPLWSTASHTIKDIKAALASLKSSESANGQQNLLIEKDKLTGRESRSTNYNLVGVSGRTGELRLKVTQLLEKDSTLRLDVKIHRSTSRCLGAESKLLMKCGEEIFTLKLSGKNDCGSNLEDYTDLSPDNVKYLINNKIDSIRVRYLNGFDVFDDFTLTKVRDETWTNYYHNNSEYFIKTLKYFEK